MSVAHFLYVLSRRGFAYLFGKSIAHAVISSSFELPPCPTLTLCICIHSTLNFQIFGNKVIFERTLLRKTKWTSQLWENIMIHQCVILHIIILHCFGAILYY